MGDGPEAAQRPALFSRINECLFGVIRERERASWAARSLVRWRRGQLQRILECPRLLHRLGGAQGRHQIEKFGERWYGGGESSVGSHVKGAVVFSDLGLADALVVGACLAEDSTILPYFDVV
jgi:hypothetical protein